MYKYRYYRKTIKPEYQETLGLKEYKRTLKDINEKYENIVKSFIELGINYVYKKIDQFNKDMFKEHMELVYHRAVLHINGVNYNDLNDLFDKYLSIKTNEEKDYTLEELFEIFEKYENNGKLRKETLKNNAGYRKQFSDFLPEGIKYSEISREQLELFRDENKLGAGSWNNLLAQLNKCFKYLMEKKELIKDNKLKILDKKEVVYIQEDDNVDFEESEVEYIINNCKNKKIKMAMTIQAFTGMRIGEITLLRYKNLKNLEEININYLQDTSTKKHNRVIPIHSTLKNELIKYFKDQEIIEDDTLLFNPSLVNAVNKYLKKIVEEMNINKEENERAGVKTTHSFRYKFIQILNYNHPELSNYISVISAHKSIMQKDLEMNFTKYNRSKTKWEVVVKLINCINYKII